MAVTMPCLSYRENDGVIRWFGLESMRISTLERPSAVMPDLVETGETVWKFIKNEPRNTHFIYIPCPLSWFSQQMCIHLNLDSIYYVPREHGVARYDKYQHFMEFENSLPCSLGSVIDLCFGPEEFQSTNSHPIALTSSIQ
jgi:hypothetical protein